MSSIKRSSAVIKRNLVIICNAFDDKTRIERSVTTDSPAASRKVLMLAQVMRSASVRPLVLSLGRGAPNGSYAWHSSTVRRERGVPILYLPFSHVRLVSSLVTLISLAAIIFYLWKRHFLLERVLFYNRMNAYLTGAIILKALRVPALLDLEDGETKEGTGLNRILAQINRTVYRATCRRGAIVACDALKASADTDRTIAYYGVADPFPISNRDWNASSLGILLGGTLNQDTGAGTLIAALDIIRKTQPDWAKQLTIEISGSGSALPDLRRAASPGHGCSSITIHGRLSDFEYRELVAGCHIGLSLKVPDGPLANTTFPSKVIELASAGLAVVCTDISDVRKVLGEHALYLTGDSTNSLLEALRTATTRRDLVRALAFQSSTRIQEMCGPLSAGQRLRKFIFDDPHEA